MDHISESKKSIISSMEQSPWWKYVQKEVKGELYKVISSLEKVGTRFRDAYTNSFQYFYAMRLSQGRSKVGYPGIFGKISEETYQSSILPTKMLLNLDDWNKPNDADVQACMLLCQHIDILEGLGILKNPPEDAIGKFGVTTDILKKLLQIHEPFTRKHEPTDFPPHLP